MKNQIKFKYLLIYNHVFVIQTELCFILSIVM